MSLIGEALKKARQEAARQDALRQRTPYAVGAADSPDRRAGVLPLLAGLGAGCLIAAILVAAAWSAGWGPFARPAQPSQKAVQVAETAPPSPASPPATIETGASQPAVPEAVPPAIIEDETAAPPVREIRPQPSIEPRPAEPPAVRPSPAPPAAAPVQEERPPAAPPISPPPAPARSAPAPAAGAANLVDGHVYAGEVPVPGGGTLKLNGIAYSQERPVVVLDGRVMGTGETIQGFTIVAIEAGRVKLAGHGATVFVSPN